MKNLIDVKVTRPNQKIIIMRGIPGSGKSTRAKTLVGEGVIHSTDTLIDATGGYDEFFNKMLETDNWTPLKQLHQENLDNFKKSLFEGISPVIVDNTNLTITQIRPYITTALEMGLNEDNIVIEDIGLGGLTANQLAERNTHNIDLEKINKMVMQYNSNKILTVEKVMEISGNRKPHICSVILDSDSRDNLINKLEKLIPEDWEIIAHHMTIHFGKGLPDNLRGELNKRVKLTVTKVGSTDKVIAVMVNGFYSDNKIPHITVAVNRKEGGKPVMSHNITQWMDMRNFEIFGTVTEEY